MEKNNINFDRYFNFKKILIFGDNHVGKSTFINRINSKEFVSEYTKSNGNLILYFINRYNQH